MKAIASPCRAPDQGEKMKTKVVLVTLSPRTWEPGVL